MTEHISTCVARTLDDIAKRHGFTNTDADERDLRFRAEIAEAERLTDESYERQQRMLREMHTNLAAALRMERDARQERSNILAAMFLLGFLMGMRDR